MSANILKNSDLLFMKVGLHAGETLEVILDPSDANLKPLA